MKNLSAWFATEDILEEVSDFELPKISSSLERDFKEKISRHILEVEKTFEESRSHLSVDFPFDEEFVTKILSQTSDFSYEISADIPAYEYQFDEDKICQVDAETGDDHISYGSQPQVSVMETLLVRTLFGVKYSAPDTFVSKVCGNFAEQWIVSLGNKFESYDSFLRGKSSRASPVVDTPNLRVVLPVARQHVMHSDVTEGKTSLIGRKLAYVKPNDPLYRLNHLIGLAQDVLLGTHQERKFPYIADRIGGYDKPVPFNNPENLLRAMKSYKNGFYSVLLTTIMDKVHRLMNPSKDFERDQFLEHVKKLYVGFQPWFTTYLQHPDKFKDLPESVTKHEAGRFGLDYFTDAALRRLKQLGELVSEDQVVVKLNVQEYFKLLLQEESFDGFQKRVQSLKSEKTDSISWIYKYFFTTEVYMYAVPVLYKHVASLISRFDLESTNQIRNYLSHEKLFWKEAVDEIYLAGPLRVSVPIDLGTRRVNRVFFGTKKKVRLTRDMEEEIFLLKSWLAGEQIELPPQELIEDDEIIIESIRRQKELIYKELLVPIVMVVTDDKRLCAAINQKLDVVVLRLPSRFLNPDDRGRWDEKIRGFQSQIAARIPFMSGVQGKIRVYQDTGSLQAYDVLRASEAFTRDPKWSRTSLFSEQSRKRVQVASIIEIEQWPTGPGYAFDYYFRLRISENGRIRERTPSLIHHSIGADAAARRSSDIIRSSPLRSASLPSLRLARKRLSERFLRPFQKD